MEVIKPPAPGQINLDFICFPAYARYILHHELDDFVKELVAAYEENGIPLLQFFESMEASQMHALVLASSREMLTYIAANDIEAYVKQAISNWTSNKMPGIAREQVHSQDITLVNYARRTIFRKFISRYTEELPVAFQLIEEIDRFSVMFDVEGFATYTQVQQQRINAINEALQKREQQLLEAQEVGQVGCFEWDFSGKASVYTKQTLNIFGLEKASNLSAFLNYVHPEDRDKVTGALKKAMEDGDYGCEYRYVKDGAEKIIFSRGKVHFEDGKPARMIGTVTDVTEHHKIIRKLQESEKLHKQAQAITHIGNWSWSIKENRITWSDEMYRIFGLEPQSEQITVERFLAFVHPEDRSESVAQIRMALSTLRVSEHHFRIIASNGMVKTLRGKGEITTDEHEAPAVLLGTCQDITREYTLTQQLKDREKYLQELNHSLELANAELTRTNEELESFNYIASHDLQEPLRKIQIYSNRILDNGFGDLSPSLKEYVGKISNASRRMQKLIEDFLSFSQRLNTSQELEAVDLEKLVIEITGELSTRIDEKHATIETSNLPTLWAVRFQIKQLMTNLLSNALKYSHSDVPPHILITGAIVKGSDIPSENAPKEALYSKISVADNGIGFDPRYSNKIFELFQRLHNKNVYSGTGIGLALCKKIVQHMNGVIKADSEPGQGSVFTFYLPVGNTPSALTPSVNSSSTSG